MWLVQFCHASCNCWNSVLHGTQQEPRSPKYRQFFPKLWCCHIMNHTSDPRRPEWLTLRDLTVKVFPSTFHFRTFYLEMPRTELEIPSAGQACTLEHLTLPYSEPTIGPSHSYRLLRPWGLSLCQHLPAEMCKSSPSHNTTVKLSKWTEQLVTNSLDAFVAIQSPEQSAGLRPTRHLGGGPIPICPSHRCLKSGGSGGVLQ